MTKITNHTVDGEEVNIWHPEKDSSGYSISSDSGSWMPGTYDCIESAELGAKACFINESKFVTELQQPINHFDKQNRLLTIEDVSEWLNQHHDLNV